MKLKLKNSKRYCFSCPYWYVIKSSTLPTDVSLEYFLARWEFLIWSRLFLGSSGKGSEPQSFNTELEGVYWVGQTWSEFIPGPLSLVVCGKWPLIIISFREKCPWGQPNLYILCFQENRQSPEAYFLGSCQCGAKCHLGSDVTIQLGPQVELLLALVIAPGYDLECWSTRTLYGTPVQWEE